MQIYIDHVCHQEANWITSKDSRFKQAFKEIYYDLQANS